MDMDDIKAMTIHQVGVIGTGIMGSGVSQNLAQSGYQVIAIDICGEALEHARLEIKTNLRFHRMFNKQQEGESPEKVLEHIEFSTDFRKLSEADFIIENVTEKWETKKAVYKEIDSIC